MKIYVVIERENYGCHCIRSFWETMAEAEIELNRLRKNADIGDEFFIQRYPVGKDSKCWNTNQYLR